VVTPRLLEPEVAPVTWKRVIGVQTGQRPLVVWISDMNPDTGVENPAFDDVYVRLALRAFRTVRITPAMAKADPVLAPYAGSAPAMVVLAPDLTHPVATNGSSLDARTALDALRASAKAEGVDLDAGVARAKALIVDKHAAEGLKATLDRRAEDYAARAAELDRRLATARAELDLVLRPQAPRTK
jgi:hypothetical protein